MCIEFIFGGIRLIPRLRLRIKAESFRKVLGFEPVTYIHHSSVLPTALRSVGIRSRFYGNRETKLLPCEETPAVQARMLYVRDYWVLPVNSASSSSTPFLTTIAFHQISLVFLLYTYNLFCV